MYKNGLKTIAVFASGLQSEYQKVICQHISIRAYELGYNVAIISWNNPYGQHMNFLKGEIEIFNLIDFEIIDAIIYLKDTFCLEYVEETLEKKLLLFKGPKVSIRSKIDGYFNVVIDNESGIYNMVEHFVREHKCTRIAYMSGKREMVDAQTRLASFRRAMQDFNIEYDESYVFHGDYWKDKAVEAVDQFLASPRGVPEVIICANDYMAIAIMHELIDRGYRIPKDIKVTGVDNISESSESIPSLTTIDIPIRSMAEEAVVIINDIFNGKHRDENNYIEAAPLYRDSCGCGDNDVWKAIRERNHTLDQFASVGDHQRSLRFFTVALEDTTTLSEVSGVIDNYIHMNGNYKNFFLCMTRVSSREDMETISSTTNGYTEESLCALALVDRGHTGEYPLVFNTHDLIPSIYTTEEPQIYYFTPLHFLEKNYGYTAISYYDFFGLSSNYYSFSTHISNAIDSLYNKIQLRAALRRLEELYISDPLTGLFNRRGFEQQASAVFSQCKANNIPLMLIAIDMDDLKYINDTYGHIQGDNAIQLLGKALSYSSMGKEICARVGGDEFNVIAGDYSQDELDDFMSSVLNYIESYNEISDVPYNINASYGVILVREFSQGDLEYYMNISDDLMYKQKGAKKKENGVIKGKDTLKTQ